MIFTAASFSSSQPWQSKLPAQIDADASSNKNDFRGTTSLFTVSMGPHCFTKPGANATAEIAMRRPKPARDNRDLRSHPKRQHPTFAQTSSAPLVLAGCQTIASPSKSPLLERPLIAPSASNTAACEFQFLASHETSKGLFGPVLPSSSELEVDAALLVAPPGARLIMALERHCDGYHSPKDVHPFCRKL